MRAGEYLKCALDKWSFDYLVERVGSEIVTVEVSSPNANTPEDEAGALEEMSIRELIARYRNPVPGKVHYYAENRIFLDLPALADDVEPLPFVPGPLITKTAGIVGSTGSYSYVHLHGLTEAILTQIVGKKRVWVWDEEDADKLHLYDRMSLWNLSAIGFRRREVVDVERFPNYREVSRVYEVVLEPGDMLYIPTFSAHNAWCETAENISLTNFWATNPAVYSTEAKLRLLAIAMAWESAKYLTPNASSRLSEIYRLGLNPAAQRVMAEVSAD